MIFLAPTSSSLEDSPPLFLVPVTPASRAPRHRAESLWHGVTWPSGPASRSAPGERGAARTPSARPSQPGPARLGLLPGSSASRVKAAWQDLPREPGASGESARGPGRTQRACESGSSPPTHRLLPNEWGTHGSFFTHAGHTWGLGIPAPRCIWEGTEATPQNYSLAAFSLHPTLGKGHRSLFSPKVAELLFNHSVMSGSLRPHGLQHVRLPCPSPTPGVHPNSCPLNQWCHPTISSSVVPFSLCL